MKKYQFLTIAPSLLSLLIFAIPGDINHKTEDSDITNVQQFFADQIQPVFISQEELIYLLDNTPERKAIRLKLVKNDVDNWVLKAWGATAKGGRHSRPKTLSIFSSGNTEPFTSFDQSHKNHYITRGEIRAALGIPAQQGTIDPTLIKDGIILNPCRDGETLRFYISSIKDGPRACVSVMATDPGTSNPAPPGFDCGSQCDDPTFN